MRKSEFGDSKLQMINSPCLAHYPFDRENVTTTDRCNTGLETRILQKQKNIELKPIAFATLYLNITGKRYASGKLEYWEVFRYFSILDMYRKLINSFTDHHLLQPLLR